SSFVIKTFFIFRTLSAQAIVRVAFDEIPDGGFRPETEIAPAAVLRLSGPFTDFHQLLFRGLLTQERLHSLGGDPQPSQTDVVGSALDQNGTELLRHHFLKEGNIFSNQLFLQADGMSGNHNREFVIASSSLNSWNQVRETLADAGAGFDDQMMAI